MNLFELKVAVDTTIDHLFNQNPEDVKVLITLSESSMGARASSDVQYAGIGFDWEREQFRIEPSKPLISQSKATNNIRPVWSKVIDGYHYYFCPECNSGIHKYDNYCRFCGQKLRRDNE